MIKIRVDTKAAKALKKWLQISKYYRKASDKAILAEMQRMLREAWTKDQKTLLNMEARRLAQWLKTQRD